MATSTLLRFLGLRAVSALVLMLVAASGMLLLTRLAPGDSVSVELSGASDDAMARERARLGLDRPFTEQYAAWLARAVRFDFGTSVRYRRPVTTLVIERAANTALLGVTALIAATIVGLPLGVIAGGGRSPLIARLVRAASLLALSLPPLLTALVLAWSAARTGWFPIGGISSSGAADWPALARLRDLAWHLTLPAFALAVPLAATFERLQAEAVMAARAEAFVLGARARGLPPSRVLWREVWRPALGPVLAIYGLSAGQLLSGSLAVELVTAWPGLGRLTLDALSARDLPLAAGCAAAAALFLAVWTTIGDLLIAAADPRTRAGLVGDDGEGRR